MLVALAAAAVVLVLMVVRALYELKVSLTRPSVIAMVSVVVMRIN